MRILVILALLSACAPPVPTYHDDVAPIIAKRCGDCHTVGPRAFTASNITQSMPAMLAAVDAGRMPPWLPSGGDVTWANDRTVTASERKLLGDWLINPVMGMPHTAEASSIPTADITLSRSYMHTGQEAIRCFIIDPPPGSVVAYGWALDSDSRAAAHHMSADLIAAVDSPAVRQLDRGDGWDCTSQALPAPVRMSFASSSTAPGERFSYPSGYGMRVEAGDALVVNVHLTGPTATLDYGVNLWYGREPIKPTQLWAILAPSQLECPPSMRGEARCQLAEASKQIVPGVMPSRAENLATCGGPERYGIEADGWYPVYSSCEGDLFLGLQRVISVTAHAHLKAKAIRVSAQRPDGEWFTLLNIPRWRWRWEGVYAPAQPLTISGRVRVDCDFDNGPATQQSAVVPWSDPPVPPLLPVEMSVWGDARKWPAEMCQARIEMAPL